MKKFVLALIAILALSIGITAAEPIRKYELTLGPVYTWSETAHVQSTQDINWANAKLSFKDDVGFYAGFFLPLSENFGFYPGFTAQWDGEAWSADDPINSITFKTYTLDLDARYNFQFKYGTFYVMGGPTATFYEGQSKLSANAGAGLSLKTFADWFRLTFEGKYRINPGTFEYRDVYHGNFTTARPETWTAFMGVTLKF